MRRDQRLPRERARRAIAVGGDRRSGLSGLLRSHPGLLPGISCRSPPVRVLPHPRRGQLRAHARKRVPRAGSINCALLRYLVGIAEFGPRMRQVRNRRRRPRPPAGAARPERVALQYALFQAALAAADLPRGRARALAAAAPRAGPSWSGSARRQRPWHAPSSDTWRGRWKASLSYRRGLRYRSTKSAWSRAATGARRAQCVAAAGQVMHAVTGLSADDLVIALVSGGGSALCALPAEGLELEEKQRITRALLARGASISEFNTVRRHLSAIKGGRLAARASPARVLTLLISDIPGDDPALVASGPTLVTRRHAATPSACRNATASKSPRMCGLHSKRVVGSRSEPDDPRLAGHQHRLISCARHGLRCRCAGSCRTWAGLPYCPMPWKARRAIWPRRTRPSP